MPHPPDTGQPCEDEPDTACPDTENPDMDNPCLENRPQLNKEKRNIDRRYYAYAYVNDYANVEYEGIKMDCISNLVRIQRRVYEQCDKKDFKEEYYRE